MGWFTNAVSDAKLTREEAFAGILLGSIAADGEIVEEEVMGLSATLLRMQLYRDWSDRDFQRVFRRLCDDLKREGLSGLLPRLVEALPLDLRETAFVNACDLVLSDGVEAEEETRFLAELRGHLGLSEEYVRRVVEVISAKNRG